MVNRVPRSGGYFDVVISRTALWGQQVIPPAPTGARHQSRTPVKMSWRMGLGLIRRW
jgi:hypothetical protein